jgi:hypothetical protein
MSAPWRNRPVSLAAAQRLPEFIAVGPPRTGTTWLDRVLTGHVGLPEGIKETQFFSWYYSQGLVWYQAHFPNCPPDLPMGEIATTYFDSSMARVRIKEDIPQCRIICTLRDPVPRLFSHYRQLRREGFLGKVTLEQAIENHHRWDGPGNMFSVSRYAENVHAWQEKFGVDRVLVVLYDDLQDNPQAYLDQVTRFIGIPNIDLGKSPVGGAKINEMNEAPKSYKLARRAREVREWLRRRKLYSISERCDPLWNYCFGRGETFAPADPAVEASLRDYFRPEVEALETLLTRDLTPWKQSRRDAA